MKPGHSHAVLLSLLFLWIHFKLRFLFSPLGKEFGGQKSSFSPLAVLHVFSPFLSLPVMLGWGWLYARDQTEAGEVKGGAAAAAAKVQNTITITLTVVHTDCSWIVQKMASNLFFFS